MKKHAFRYVQSFSIKNSLREVWGSQKIESVKNIIQLQKFFKSVQVQYMIALFWNLALALLVLELHCYCGDTVKYGLISKHLFQRKQQYGG